MKKRPMNIWDGVWRLVTKGRMREAADVARDVSGCWRDVIIDIVNARDWGWRGSGGDWYSQRMCWIWRLRRMNSGCFVGRGSEKS